MVGSSYLWSLWWYQECHVWSVAWFNGAINVSISHTHTHTHTHAHTHTHTHTKILYSAEINFNNWLVGKAFANL